MAPTSISLSSAWRGSHFSFRPPPSSNRSLLLLRAPCHGFLALPRPCSFPIPLSPRRANAKVSVAPVVTASFQVPAGIRPGSAVETDKLPSDVRKRAMNAVDSYGGRVTTGDIASKAGLKLAEAERALQALAADTGGFLEVSDEGDVVYAFPKDYRSKLAAKSFMIRAEPVLDKVNETAAYLIRVSFGTALIASIVLVYTTIIALISSQSDEDNRGRRRGRSYGSSVNVFFSPTDLFWYWDANYYRRRQRSTDDQMNFIESVFSFVFGDGNPNQGLEEERWKLIGQYIASNAGVVTAEELAPYLDVLPADQTKEDESFILPVLLQFQGNPEVDEQGNILYRFPSLQRTASSKKIGQKEYVGTKWSEMVNGFNKYFKENKWKFSKTSTSERAMVIGLGALNLFGVVILGTMLKEITVTPGSFVSFVAQLFPLLQIYAASFFAIPLFRWLLLLKNNQDIMKRNQARQEQARALELPEPSLRRKLLSARDMARQKVIRPEEIVYSTQKDILEQDYEGREWDRRIKELESD